MSQVSDPERTLIRFAEKRWGTQSICRTMERHFVNSRLGCDGMNARSDAPAILQHFKPAVLDTWIVVTGFRHGYLSALAFAVFPGRPQLNPPVLARRPMGAAPSSFCEHRLRADWRCGPAFAPPVRQEPLRACKGAEASTQSKLTDVSTLTVSLEPRPFGSSSAETLTSSSQIWYEGDASAAPAATQAIGLHFPRRLVPAHATSKLQRPSLDLAGSRSSRHVSKFDGLLETLQLRDLISACCKLTGAWRPTVSTSPNPCHARPGEDDGDLMLHLPSCRLVLLASALVSSLPMQHSGLGAKVELVSLMAIATVKKLEWRAPGAELNTDAHCGHWIPLSITGTGRDRPLV
jgi:hypothetical protein